MMNSEQIILKAIAADDMVTRTMSSETSRIKGQQRQ